MNESIVSGHMLREECFDAIEQINAVFVIRDAVQFVELGDQFVWLTGFVESGHEFFGLIVGNHRIITPVHD